MKSLVAILLFISSIAQAGVADFCAKLCTLQWPVQPAVAKPVCYENGTNFKFFDGPITRQFSSESLNVTKDNVFWYSQEGPTADEYSCDKQHDARVKQYCQKFRNKFTKAYFKDRDDTFFELDVNVLNKQVDENHDAVAKDELQVVTGEIQYLTPCDTSEYDDPLFRINPLNAMIEDESGKPAVSHYMQPTSGITVTSARMYNGLIWLGTITALVAGGVYAWKKLKNIDEVVETDETVEAIDEQSK